MADENGKLDGKDIVGATAAAVNSKAANKLAGAVDGLVQLSHNVVDYVAGPKRITQIHEARAQGALIAAKTELEIERISAERECVRAETAEYLLDRETRKTLNRRAIVAEAQKALPKPGEPVSDAPVSRDFVHSFFEEFDGISDPEVHKIVGRLLANEVTRPGSYPRRTMRVLRDLESSDFALFTTLCRFSWMVGQLTPLVFEFSDPIYQQHGLDLDKFKHLEALGLTSVEGLSGYSRTYGVSKFLVAYGATPVLVDLKKGQKLLSIGKVLFTDAGQRLAPLTRSPIVPEFIDYVLEKWRADGQTVKVVSKEEALAFANEQAQKREGADAA